MRSMKSTAIASTAIITILMGFGAASAQQITGTPGNPDATTTVDGRYLPNPRRHSVVRSGSARKTRSPIGRRRSCPQKARRTSF